MIQHVWTVPCRVSIVDATSNNVSLIEVIEEIEISPYTLARKEKNRIRIPLIFDVITLWTRGDIAVPEIGWGRIAFTSPTKEVLVESIFDVDLREARRTRTSGKFLGLPISEDGLYSFVISRKLTQVDSWEDVAHVPLEVQLDPSATNGDQTSAAI